MQVRGYRFVRSEPVPLRAIGLTGRNSVVVWVQNRGSMCYYWDCPVPKAVTGAELTIHGAPGGRLRVEWLDTWTGRSLGGGKVAASDGTVTLEVPGVQRGVACRLLREPGGGRAGAQRLRVAAW